MKSFSPEYDIKLHEIVMLHIDLRPVKAVKIGNAPV